MPAASISAAASDLENDIVLSPIVLSGGACLSDEFDIEPNTILARFQGNWGARRGILWPLGDARRPIGTAPAPTSSPAAVVRRPESPYLTDG
jgi:hypothetical protein